VAAWGAVGVPCHRRMGAWDDGRVGSRDVRWAVEAPPGTDWVVHAVFGRAFGEPRRRRMGTWNRDRMGGRVIR